MSFRSDFSKDWAVSDLIWYASYGSNVDRERFLLYLEGGPLPGSDHVESGARDPAPPRADSPIEFSHQISFVGRSSRWGGAPAFLNHSPAPGPAALGRRYLVTVEQLEDLVAQENLREPSPLPIDQLEVGVVRQVGPGGYDGLMLVGTDEGTPIVTFTSPVPPESRPPAAPAQAYLATLMKGLAVAHQLPAIDIATRLGMARGVERVWSVEMIASLGE